MSKSTHSLADAVQYIAGPIAEMAPKTLEMLQKFHAVLELPAITEDVSDDPLGEEAAAPQSKPTATRLKAAAVKKRVPVRKGGKR